jgi:GNAT superfamily N-acetyltransferase
VDRDKVLALFTLEQRIEYDAPDAIREETGGVIRTLSTEESRGFVLYTDLNEHNIEQAIDEQVAYFSRRNEPFEWKVFDYDQPPDLKEHLRARGFEIGEPEALVVLDLNEHPAFLKDPIPASIRRIDLDEIDAVMKMEEAVWGEDHSDLGAYLKTYASKWPEYMSFYAAFADEQIVSAAWIHFSIGGSFASLWGGSTLPAYRQRGFYTGLLNVRAQEALQRGFRYLYVDASPMSQPILEKHGFQLLGYSYPCEWEPETPNP